MIRFLVLGTLALLSPRDLAAQHFQFMKLAAGGVPTSLPPLQAVAIGHIIGDDFDGNGHGDLLVPTPGGALMFHGTATGWSSGLGTGCNGQRPRPFDLDGDGDRDLVFVPPSLSTPTTLLLYQNTPSGMVWQSPPWGLGGVSLQGVAPGDIDGNRIPDLVVATRSGPVLPPLVLARGAPGLAYTVDVTSMPTGLPYGLWPELSVVRCKFGAVREAGGSVARMPADVGGAVTHPIAADVDGDQRTDVVLAYHQHLGLNVASGGGHYRRSEQPLPSTQGASSMASRVEHADLDRDRDIDVVVRDGDHIRILGNDGTGTFTLAMLRASKTWGIDDLQLGLFCIGFALASPPLLLPGVTGRLEIDPTLLQVATGFTMSPVGVSSAFVAVPADPALLWLELWFQGLLLPTTGNPALTNAIAEMVIR